MEILVQSALRCLGLGEDIGGVDVELVLTRYAIVRTATDAQLWRQAAALFVLVRGLGVPVSRTARRTGHTIEQVRCAIRAFENAPDAARRPAGLHFTHHLAAAEANSPAKWLQRAVREGLTPAQLTRAVRAAKRTAKTAAARAPVGDAVKRELAALARAAADSGQPVTAEALQKVARRHRVSYASVLGALGALAEPAPNAALVAELSAKHARAAAERDGAVAQLNETVAQRDNAVAEASSGKTRIAALERELESLTTHCETYKKIALNARKQVGKADDRRHKLARELFACQRVCAEKDQTIETLRAENTDLAARLQQIARLLQPAV